MTSLTEQQQELVAQNLPIVHWVICDYIHVKVLLDPDTVSDEGVHGQ